MGGKRDVGGGELSSSDKFRAWASGLRKRSRALEAEERRVTTWVVGLDREQLGMMHETFDDGLDEVEVLEIAGIEIVFDPVGPQTWLCSPVGASVHLLAKTFEEGEAAVRRILGHDRSFFQ